MKSSQTNIHPHYQHPQPRAQRAARLGPHLGTLLVSLYAALARLPNLRHAFAAAAATTGGMLSAAAAGSSAPSSAMSAEDERKVATAVIHALRRCVRTLTDRDARNHPNAC